MQAREKMNILVMGSLSSGSSALHDLLREYDNIYCVPGEFDDFRVPGLVADQLNRQSALDHPNRIAEAVREAKTGWRLFYGLVPGRVWDDRLNYRLLFYLDRLMNFPHEKGAREGIIHKARRILSLRYTKQKMRTIRLNQLYLLDKLNKSLMADIPFEEKRYLARKWVQQVAGIWTREKEMALFDQPLLTGPRNLAWTEVFKPFKLIHVIREPKDQLADMIRRGVHTDPFRTPVMTYTVDNLASIYGTERKGMIRFNVDAMKARNEWLDYLEGSLPRDQLLIIDFEGLVNMSDQYKATVEKFLGVDPGHHTREKRYFDPGISWGNTGIYKKYLGESDLCDMAPLERWYLEKKSNLKLN